MNKEQQTESEVRFVENQLNIRNLVDKTVKFVGLATFMTLSANVSANDETENTNRGDSMTISASNTDSEQVGLVPYMSVKKKAEFPGGTNALMDFLKTNLVYPEAAQDSIIQGKVFVEFVVEKDGSITNMKILRAVHPLLDAEAIRVVSIMPKWNPATENGKPIRSKFKLPFNFKLNK